MKYVIRTRIKDVIRHQPVVRVDKDGTAHTVDRGWFVHLEGAYEAIFVGHEKPVMQTGDKVQVTIELEG